MYDKPLFLQTLSRFAVVLPGRYDLEAALTELTESLTSVLGLSGSGVTMADEGGRLRFVTAVSQASGIWSATRSSSRRARAGMPSTPVRWCG